MATWLAPAASFCTCPAAPAVSVRTCWTNALSSPVRPAASSICLQSTPAEGLDLHCSASPRSRVSRRAMSASALAVAAVSAWLNFCTRAAICSTPVATCRAPSASLRVSRGRVAVPDSSFPRPFDSSPAPSAAFEAPSASGACAGREISGSRCGLAQLRLDVGEAQVDVVEIRLGDLGVQRGLGSLHDGLRDGAADVVVGVVGAQIEVALDGLVRVTIRRGRRLREVPRDGQDGLVLAVRQALLRVAGRR